MATVKGLTGMAGDAAVAVSHLHTAVDTMMWVFSAISGKPAPDDAPVAVKAMSGVLGKGDEISMQHMLQALRQSYIDETADKVAAQERADKGIKTLTIFIDKNYRDEKFKTPTGRVLMWWYLNQWRVLITKMSTDPVKIGTKTIKGKSSLTETAMPPENDVEPWVLFGPTGLIVSKGPKSQMRGGDHSADTVIETDIYSSRDDQGVNFLRFIIHTIESADTPEEGHEEVLHYFKTWGIPVMPNEDPILWFQNVVWTLVSEKAPAKIKQLYVDLKVADRIEAAWDTTMEFGAATALEANQKLATYADYRREKDAGLPWYSRALNKIIPFS